MSAKIDAARLAQALEQYAWWKAEVERLIVLQAQPATTRSVWDSSLWKCQAYADTKTVRNAVTGEE